MTLTAAVFQQILTSLRSDTGRRFNEQRNGPRVGVRGRIRVMRAVPGAPGIFASPVEVWVRDVSVSGIGILTSQPYATNTRIRALFPKSDDEPLALLYTVVHCKPVSKGLYVVGARLADVPQSQPKADNPGAVSKAAAAAAKTAQKSAQAKEAAGKGAEGKNGPVPAKAAATKGSAAGSAGPRPPARSPARA
jgi:hypothetical protein